MFAIRLINHLAAYRRRRQTILKLASLTDHQLKDIGVTRYDLFAPTSSR